MGTISKPIKPLPPLYRDMLHVFQEAGTNQSVTKALLWTRLEKYGKQEALDRRLRALREFGYTLLYDKSSESYRMPSFERREDRDTRYINGKLRAEALAKAHGKCQMCGDTIIEDGIKLVVDHRVPHSWGGKTESENLWAICERCNHGKKNFFATLDDDVMKKCMIYNIIEQRLGELLKVYNGQIVPRRLLELVGEQEQWTRRLRTLRQLGWLVDRAHDPSEVGRYTTTYKLVQAKPWPDDLAAHIRHLNGRKRTITD